MPNPPRTRCSQCRREGSQGITEDELFLLADPGQVEAGAGAYGGGLGVGASLMGLAVLRRHLLRRFSRYSFCAACRERPAPSAPHYRAIKALAVTAFFAGFLIVGLPLAIVLYLVAAILVRREFAGFAAAPRFASLGPLLEAYAVLVTSATALGLLVLVMAGVVVYIEAL